MARVAQRRFPAWIGLAALALLGSTAFAQGPPDTRGEVVAPVVQSAAEALAQDAAEYARHNDVTLAEAVRRLRAQEESVGETDRLRDRYSDRLAGISIEHNPVFRIVVLLTGDDPVADRTILAGGLSVPIVFRTGAVATREAVVDAIRTHQATIRARLARPPGLGLDPRTGELVVVIGESDAGREDLAALDAELEDLTSVPIRLRVVGAASANLAPEDVSRVGGGSRVEGVDPGSGRRYACTTGFVVTDGARTGVVTAAHCPDALTHHAPGGGTTALDFVGQWGVGYQDVQVNVSPQAQRPLFYVDSGKTGARVPVGVRPRASTRAGDAVCHRGEATGYSCSQVEFVDYAPPGDLCGGPCAPAWVTVAGPSCRGGDSGGPIFSGNVAFGIAKGGTYDRAGRCSFYFYMSTDYLPVGWSLLKDGQGLAGAVSKSAGPRRVRLR